MSDGDRATRLAHCELVRTYVQMINAWDFDAMDRVLAESVVFEMRFPPPGMPPRLEGKEALLAYQKKCSKVILAENLHDLWLDTLYSDPAEVIAEYRSDMTLRDPAASYRNDYFARFTVRDGLIYRFQENFDSARAIEAFGGTVLPP